jgi:hypothetical protein
MYPRYLQMYRGDSRRTRHRLSAQLYASYMDEAVDGINAVSQNLTSGTHSTLFNSHLSTDSIADSSTCVCDDDLTLDSSDAYYFTENDSDDDNHVKCEEKSVEQIVHDWSVKCNIPDVSTSMLLRDLQPVVPSIKIITAASLHKKYVPMYEDFQEKQLSSGSYVHFGLVFMVKKIIDPNYLWPVQCGLRTVHVQLACDGIALYKSSTSCFWPLMGRLLNGPNVSPFCIGLYYGSQKPQMNEYLTPLCEEIKELQTPFFVDGAYYQAEIVNIIADAPARSMLKGTKSFSGYYGCDYCHDKGQYMEHKVVYSCQIAALRLDKEFLEFDEGHQLSITPFLGLISFQKAFPPEYMHTVCLGVMRRLLFMWCRCDKRYPTASRLLPSVKVKLSHNLVGLGQNLPLEFHRKTRPLNDLERWKAIEYRTFLLYIGPFVLKDILPNMQWKHFLILHASIYILSCQSLMHIYSDAKQLLTRYVYDFEKVYGASQMVYNVHCLLHISDFALEFGSLDKWSAFPFENFLWKLKRRIRSPNHPLKQAVTAVQSSLLNSSSNESSLTYRTFPPNNFCIIANGFIVEITVIHSSNAVDGSVWKLTANLYDYPCDSSVLCIGWYSKTNEFVAHCMPINKCICLNTDNDGNVLLIPYVR